MHATTPITKDKPIYISIDPNKIGRGYGFIAMLKRGGKHLSRRHKKPRTHKQKEW